MVAHRAQGDGLLVGVQEAAADAALGTIAPNNASAPSSSGGGRSPVASRWGARAPPLMRTAIWCVDLAGRRGIPWAALGNVPLRLGTLGGDATSAVISSSPARTPVTSRPVGIGSSLGDAADARHLPPAFSASHWSGRAAQVRSAPLSSPRAPSSEEVKSPVICEARVPSWHFALVGDLALDGRLQTRSRGGASPRK